MRSPLLPALIGFVAAGTAMLATAPAEAQAATDYRCTELVTQARTAATNATDAAQAARARRYIATGVALCEARSEGPAARQFRSALRVLGVEEVRDAPATQMAVTAPAAPTAGGN